MDLLTAKNSLIPLSKVLYSNWEELFAEIIEMEVTMNNNQVSELVQGFKDKWNRDIQNNVEKDYQQIVEEFKVDWEKANLDQKQQIVNYLTETISKYWHAIICEAEQNVFSNPELILKDSDYIWSNYAEAIRKEDGFSSCFDER